MQYLANNQLQREVSKEINHKKSIQKTSIMNSFHVNDDDDENTETTTTCSSLDLLLL